jgi:hypothetical protein
LAKLISFDIDGTLEVGNPPGYITIERVREALALGYIVGSCSDQPIRWQQTMWQEHGVTVAFTVLKHHLDRVRAEFLAEEYVHIGDTDMDRYYAERNGFAYLFPDDTVDHLWNPPESARSTDAP